jgi:hypothetical protein
VIYFNQIWLDNVFGHILVSVLSVLGGSIVFSQDDGESGSVDIASALAVVAEAKPTIFAR